MPDNINVRAIDQLHELDASLRRFAEQMLDAVEQAEAEIVRALDELDRRTGERQNEAERCEEDLERARRELEEADPDQVEEAREVVRRERRRLADAREKLDEAAHWRDRTEEEAEALRRRQRDLMELAASLTERAVPFLQHRFEDLLRYIQVTGGGIGALPRSGPAGSGRAGAGSPSAALGSPTAAAPPSPGTEPARGVQTIGTPEADRAFRHYQTGETCAIVCEQGILHKHTGQDFGEEDLTEKARVNGWWIEDEGTPIGYVGSLLEVHGVPVLRWPGGTADLGHLQHELSQGHDVIVGVNARLLYRRDVTGGHALWVTGIDIKEGRPTRVWVNDPNPGQPESYEINHFMAAWNGTSGLRTMVSTLSAASREEE